MRNKLLFFFMFPLWIMGQTALANVVALPMDTAKQQAGWLQEEENTTIENGEKSQSADNAEGGYVPTISYTDIPREYEIADVTVTGANNYDKSVIIGYSGLSKGQKIKVPGDQISQAIKKFWKQGLFSDVEISASKIDGQKIWLNIALKTRERISDIVLRGVKDKDKEDMLSAMELKKGGQLTPNLIARTKAAIKRHLAGEGYRNADVNIWVKNDPSAQGSVIVNIGVDRKEKVRVNHIYITGNSQMEEKKIKRAMKKTKERGKLVNIFKSKKFIEEEYKNDKNLAIEKFNEYGFRDAVLVSDSIVPVEDNRVDIYMTFEEGKKYFFRDITWVGNTVYPNDVLSLALGIKKGDVYNNKLLNDRLFVDEDAMSNLYLDHGYLFFNVDPVEVNVDGDSIDIELRIYEGRQAVINNVVISGNDAIYEHVIRRELRTKPGQLFSKSDLQRSARELAATGHFNPETMDIRPEPDPENGTVDIIYNLEQKKNDQVELSFGWGQTGVTGSLGLKFTNFSMRNIFNKGAYHPLPQGDGQSLSLSFSTNARYYTSASISFIEPWLGGTSPTTLSASLYWSKQSGVNSQYYSENYYNSLYYDDYSYSYASAADPDKFIMTFGGSLGIGKRLNWPDDYFSIYGELSFRHYSLQNWVYLDLSDGKANNLSLSATWSRNSLDNPYYTRRGSKFSLMVQATPPYSLFKDNSRVDELVTKFRNGDAKEEYRGLSADEYSEMQEELYKWVEYYKVEFKAQTFTPLSSNQKLVLMTRAEYGFLGYYNKNRRSPFERYYVGGDGMTGYSSTYSTTAVKLRGYGNGSLTPEDPVTGRDAGNIYTRLSLELRYPLMLETTTTIYLLAFADAGNAWSEFNDFNPFDLKRSLGVGVRVFLPMLGLIGVDWGYGFDDPYHVGEGGSNFHFVIGQEF
ncbi:MAG: BamA/TamA family outer membrane protein [Paludibacteraceae bacterium]|nr:BamA/TamA family outer membrane protein [Paludibacteraceae bacterium]